MIDAKGFIGYYRREFKSDTHLILKKYAKENNEQNMYKSATKNTEKHLK